MGPSRGRRYFLLLVLLAGFGVILFRLVNLQVLQAAELTARADRQHQKSVLLEGARGTVTDRHGKVLAMNVEVPSIFGVPTSLDNPGNAARSLSAVLRLRREEIEKKLRQDKHFVWLARKVEPEQGRRLEQLSIDGIGMVMEGRRFYPKGPLLAHVLGFVGMDGIGLEGLERRYESQLHGEKRLTILQRDALGRTVFPKGLREQPPSAGHTLTLTIDEVIQYIAEKELEEAVDHARAKSGAIIVMEPQTGAILAMAVSGACAAVIGLTFGGPASLTLLIAALWGITVIADSAQFSTAITELSPPAYVGTALTTQTCVGFTITLASIWLIPLAVQAVGWRWAFATLAVGPALGVVAMARLRTLPEARRMAGGRR